MNEIVRKTAKGVLAALACFALILSLNVENVFGYAGYDTKNFDVNVNVNENHTMEVTETIKVNFNESRHGIYRNIPYDPKVYKITGIRVEEDNYSVESSYENGTYQKVIQIGDADETITGSHTYKISYIIKAYKDTKNTADYFSLDVIPTAWESSIDSSIISVKLPKSINWQDMNIYSGIYGSTSTENNIKYHYDSANKTINITGKNMPIGEGITLQSTLPEGYWVGATDNTKLLIPMAIIIGALPLLAFIMWLACGRDPKIVKTVEFYPPEGMTPAEIGYIIDGAADTKDMVSLIMYYADKGYIKIEEYKKNKFQLVKFKEIDNSEKKFVKTFFNGIFDSENKVKMDNLPSSFAEKYVVAIDQMKGYYTGKNRIFTRSSKLCRCITSLLMLLPPVVAVIFSAFASLQFFFSLAAIPVFFFSAIGLILIMFTFDKKESIKKRKQFTRYIIGGIFVVISSIIAFSLVIYLTSKEIYALEMLASMAITFFFSILMKARTKQAALWQGHILGFKNFIKSAEIEKLKALVEEDPEYFYNIMPYAYVMGLSDKWVKKFEKIPTSAPNWYYGNDPNALFNIMWMNHMMRGCYHSMASSMMPDLSNIDSGSGNIGGGFGGGGFSGGGFGGGGGGSW